MGVNPFTGDTTPRQRPSQNSKTSADGASAQKSPAVLSIHGRLLEWHAMDPQTRQKNWENLVDWVAWLHEAYELSVDQRFPYCWHRHPGLVEELWTLKCWREALYTTNTDTGVTTGEQAGALAQHARQWHTDLRTFISQLRFYAPKCQAGHKDATPLPDRRDNLTTTWKAHNPFAAIPAPPPVEPDPKPRSADELTREAMDARLRKGTARGLGKDTDSVVESFDGWWIFDHHTQSWLKNHDEDLQRRFDALRHADHTPHQARRQQTNRSDTEDGKEDQQ